MRYYDSMGFESENGIWVRRVDIAVLEAEVVRLNRAKKLLLNALCPHSIDCAVSNEWKHGHVPACTCGYAEWWHFQTGRSARNPEEIQTFNHERDCGLTNDAGKCECSTDSGGSEHGG